MERTTHNFFNRIVSVLVSNGATTQQKAEHWPVPAHDRDIYSTLINEGVATSEIAEAFAAIRGWDIYSADMGDFIIQEDSWGICNKTLFITNPFSEAFAELLDKRDRGEIDFDNFGILEGDIEAAFDHDSGKNSTEMDQVINQMLDAALERGASDIHISPRTHKHLSIQFRVDSVRGVYQHKISMSDYTSFSNMLLTRAKKNSGDPVTPIDGQFEYTWKGRDIQIRLAATPVKRGGVNHFYFVLRLLNPTGQLRKLEDINLPDNDLQILKVLAKSPKGLILVTGPTGSGKTTTLYALLQYMQEIRPGDSIQTLEDPVEVELPGIEQTEINHVAGMTFAAGLRIKLRQDPDVILVGELRDLETAKLAVEAALTGHLVLATLHTNSASQSISRLINMGVDRAMLAEALLATTAQRMVRVVCKHCSSEAEFGENRELAIRYESLRQAPRAGDLVRSVGGKQCQHCEDGYHGRRIVSEIMIIDPWTQRKILEHAPITEIEEEHRKHQFASMWENAMALLRQQVTTLAELEARLSPMSNYGQHFSYDREINLL